MVKNSLFELNSIVREHQDCLDQQAYILHLFRTMSNAILETSPPCNEVLVNDGKVIPAGASIAIWNTKPVIVIVSR